MRFIISSVLAARSSFPPRHHITTTAVVPRKDHPITTINAPPHIHHNNSNMDDNSTSWYRFFDTQCNRFSVTSSIILRYGSTCGHDDGIENTTLTPQTIQFLAVMNVNSRNPNRWVLIAWYSILKIVSLSTKRALHATWFMMHSR